MKKFNGFHPLVKFGTDIGLCSNRHILIFTMKVLIPLISEEADPTLQENTLFPVGKQYYC